MMKWALKKLNHNATFKNPAKRHRNWRENSNNFKIRPTKRGNTIY